MKKLSKKQKYIAAGSAAIVLAAGSGAAYAYWTNTGSGSGTASTGTNTAIVVNQTSTVTGLYPGGTPATLSGNFDNSNAGPVYVAQVSVAVTSGWFSQTDLSKPKCTAADFTLVQPTATNAEVPAGNAQGAWGGGSIALNDSATNQDNCKNVSVSLTYTSN